MDENVVAVNLESLSQEDRDQLTLGRILAAVGDNGQRKVPTAQLRVASIDATFTVRALDETEFAALQTMPRDNLAAANARLVARAIVAPRMDEEFLMRLGVATVEDALRRVLLPGEVARMADQVLRLSGMDEGSVEATKN